MEILARYLERTDRPVYAAVRRDEAEAGARLRDDAVPIRQRDAYADRVSRCRRHRATRPRARPRRESPGRAGDRHRALRRFGLVPPAAATRPVRSTSTGPAACSSSRSCAGTGRPRAFLLHLDGVRGRRPQGRVRRGPARRGQEFRNPTSNRSSRRSCSSAPRGTAADPDLPAEHRRRRAGHRMDRLLQRAVRADQGVRATGSACTARAPLGCPSTWCPSTTSRMRSTSYLGSPWRDARRTTSWPAGRPPRWGA